MRSPLAVLTVGGPTVAYARGSTISPGDEIDTVQAQRGTRCTLGYTFAPRDRQTGHPAVAEIYILSTCLPSAGVAVSLAGAQRATYITTKLRSSSGLFGFMEVNLRALSWRYSPGRNPCSVSADSSEVRAHPQPIDRPPALTGALNDRARFTCGKSAYSITHSLDRTTGWAVCQVNALTMRPNVPRSSMRQPGCDQPTQRMADQQPLHHQQRGTSRTKTRPNLAHLQTFLGLTGSTTPAENLT